MVNLIDAGHPIRFSRWDSDHYFEDIRYELDLFQYHMAHSFVSRSAFTSSLPRPLANDDQDDLQRWGYVSRDTCAETDVIILRDLGLALRDTNQVGAETELQTLAGRVPPSFPRRLSRIICTSITAYFFGSCSACYDDEYLDQFERNLWGGATQIQWIYSAPTWRMMDISQLFFKTPGPKSEAAPISEAMARRICTTLEGPYLRPYTALISDHVGSSTSNQRIQGPLAEPPSYLSRTPSTPFTASPLILKAPSTPFQSLSIHDR
ncbi:hypothetical protein B0H17DRAFT_1205516 [Mycena rosella]|uniref:Uncharacterized protein n=1 Tax=Mycena rosella TaxID=1033263 RepID=A0AAD7D7L3_MYCRO|nr:hypothetical protein B0H17DRAFT_1205516 [Mycena rosella]